MLNVVIGSFEVLKLEDMALPTFVLQGKMEVGWHLPNDKFQMFAKVYICFVLFVLTSI
jgi:hypothetical protein